MGTPEHMNSTTKLQNGHTVVALPDDQSAQARTAADREHNLTFLEAVKSYPSAVAWAFFFSLGVIMAVGVLLFSSRDELM